MSSYSKQYFGSLQKQREENSGCDVTIKCEEDEYPAHKFVLSTASPYFDKLFTVDMKDKNKEVVEVTSVSSDTFKVCMAHMYNQHIKLTIHNVDSVLAAASFFQLCILTNECFEFKRTLINIKNWLEFHQLAERYLVPKFSKVAIEFLVRNFEDVMESNMEEMLNLDKNLLFQILSSNSIKVSNESVLCNLLFQWVAKDEENRAKEFDDLFKLIRLPLVSKEYLLFEALFNKLVTSSQTCTALVQESLMQRIDKKLTLEEEEILLRQENKCLVINEDCSEVFKYDVKTDEEESHTTLKTPFVINSASVITKNSLKVFEYTISDENETRMQFGQSISMFGNVSKRRKTNSRDCEYNVMEKSGSCFDFFDSDLVESPTTLKTCFPINSVNMVLYKSKIYVVKFNGEKGVYSYDFVCNSQWKKEAELPENFELSCDIVSFTNIDCQKKHAIVLHHDQILLMLMKSNNVVVESFDLISKEWNEPNNSQNIFCNYPTNFSLLSHKQTVYVIGGLQGKSEVTSLFSLQLNTQIKMRGIASLADGRFDATSCLYRNNIYIAGGLTVTNSVALPVRSVEVFNTETNTMYISTVGLPFSVRIPSSCIIESVCYIFGGKMKHQVLENNPSTSENKCVKFIGNTKYGVCHVFNI